MMPTILKTWLHTFLHPLARMLFDDGVAIFSEFAGLLGPLIRASRRRDGPMKSDIRLLCFAVFGGLIGSGYALTAPINIALAVMTILLLVTIVTPIRRAVAEVASTSPSIVDAQN